MMLHEGTRCYDGLMIKCFGVHDMPCHVKGLKAAALGDWSGEGCEWVQGELNPILVMDDASE